MTQLTPICTPVPPHIADVSTPVSVYLKLRDVYPNAILLESSDYHGHRNAMSFICFTPLAEIMANTNSYRITGIDGTTHEQAITKEKPLPEALHNFTNSFRILNQPSNMPANGLFGYTAYDAVRHFEEIKLQENPEASYAIPLMRYTLYRNIIAFNHFTNQMSLIEYLKEGDQTLAGSLIELLYNRTVPAFSFRATEAETSNVTDDQFVEMVKKGKQHCFRGDVFQIVLSRQYSQCFAGDEFNVYRALRNINPSPYLFYFDYGNYKIFGSSPEAQLVIEKGKATINPIAGTFRRTGDDKRDRELAEQLSNDPKENAEHVMLVDLARNDLSRHCHQVKVNIYKEVQYYSHVLHMVSDVSGKLHHGATTARVMAATFPAGTLSGAPKYKAMQLINSIENQPRGFYGGCIGYMGFDGSFNQAIMIRSFLSQNNTLFCQAGAGVVSQSVEANELQEVNNKLGALKKAIEMAEKF
ncbi:MAG: anthranilate synthase component I family protein [Breznakibacter sp.]